MNFYNRGWLGACCVIGCWLCGGCFYNFPSFMWLLGGQLGGEVAELLATNSRVFNVYFYLFDSGSLKYRISADFLTD